MAEKFPAASSIDETFPAGADQRIRPKQARMRADLSRRPRDREFPRHDHPPQQHLRPGRAVDRQPRIQPRRAGIASSAACRCSAAATGWGCGFRPIATMSASSSRIAAMNPDTFGQCYNATRDRNFTWRDLYREVGWRDRQAGECALHAGGWIVRHDPAAIRFAARNHAVSRRVFIGQGQAGCAGISLRDRLSAGCCRDARGYSPARCVAR